MPARRATGLSRDQILDFLLVNPGIAESRLASETSRVYGLRVRDENLRHKVDRLVKQRRIARLHTHDGPILFNAKDEGFSAAKAHNLEKRFSEMQAAVAALFSDGMKSVRDSIVLLGVGPADVFCANVVFAISPALMRRLLEIPSGSKTELDDVVAVINRVRTAAEQFPPRRSIDWDPPDPIEQAKRLSNRIRDDWQEFVNVYSELTSRFIRKAVGDPSSASDTIPAIALEALLLLGGGTVS